LSVVLALEIETSSLEQVIADVLVAPFFSCDRPLRGPAARADWRLCGLLSERLQREELTGARGEAGLIPTAGRMKSPVVLVIGLGPRAEFGEEVLREVARNAAERLLGLRSGIVGIALPGAAASRLDTSRAAGVVVEGVAEVLSEHPSALRLRLVVPPEEIGRARSGLLETASRLSSSRLAIRLEKPTVAPPYRRATPSHRTPTPPGKSAPPIDFRH
jgi:hypothetical protein